MQDHGSVTPDGAGGFFYHASDDGTGTSYRADSVTHRWARLANMSRYRRAGSARTRPRRNYAGLCQHSPAGLYGAGDRAGYGCPQLLLDLLCIAGLVLVIVAGGMWR